MRSVFCGHVVDLRVAKVVCALHVFGMVVGGGLG
jgi:hypothetical protein